MVKKKRLAGRFLPSRVYARWTWTVRFGLSVLPLILFLAGATTLYLSQDKYRSTAVFEYTGSRPDGEVLGLLESRNVVRRAVTSLDLVQRFGVDSDSAVSMVTGLTEVTSDDESGQIRVEVTHTDREIARDLAAALVTSLEDYEKSLVSEGIRNRIELAETELTMAEDETEQKQEALARLIAVRGNETQDPVARLDLDSARVAWEHARTASLDIRTRLASLKRELASPGKWTVLHTPPVVATKPVEGEKSWTYLILSALGTGLGFTLAVPYLLELAFPRVYRRGQKREDPWQDEHGEAVLSRQPA